jgi:prophage regulatory protein
MFNNALEGVNMTFTILRLPAVKSRTGLSRSTIYLRISNNEFPAPISLGARAVGWLEEDVNKWLAEKVEASRNAKS